MRKKNLLKITLGIILIIAISFFIGTKYENNKIKEDIKNKYLNTLYFELLTSISSLQYMENEFVTNPKNHIEAYEVFLKSFNKIEALNKNINFYLPLGKYEGTILFSDRINLIIGAMYYGININSTNITFTCNAFLEDGILSENEKNFLKNLSKDLETIRLALYSEETGQENPKLSFKEISNAFKDFETKYYSDNFKNLNLTN